MWRHSFGLSNPLSNWTTASTKWAHLKHFQTIPTIDFFSTNHCMCNTFSVKWRNSSTTSSPSLPNNHKTNLNNQLVDHVCQLSETISCISFGQTYFLEAKFDGVRVVTLVDGPRSFVMKSRNGNTYHSFHNFFTVDIEKLYLAAQILQSYGDLDTTIQFVLDGEMVTNDNVFTTVAGLSHSKKALLSTKQQLCYHIFDIILMEDYLEKGNRYTLEQRKEMLELVLSDQYLLTNQSTLCKRVAHQQIIFNDMKNVHSMVEAFISAGYEGIMIKDPKAYYYRGRSRAFIKAKKFQTYDLQVTGFLAGEGKNKDILGALVLTSANGKMVKVGTGLSDKLRKSIWAEKETLKGKIVEVSAQEVSKNSLRFPVFVRFREDKTEADAF